MSNILEGRRAVYTKVERQWSEDKREYVEIKRTTFHGVIVWAGYSSGGSYSGSPRVWLLYDSGSIREHDIDTITLEGDQVPTGGAYR